MDSQGDSLSGGVLKETQRGQGNEQDIFGIELRFSEAGEKGFQRSRVPGYRSGLQRTRRSGGGGGSDRGNFAGIQGGTKKPPDTRDAAGLDLRVGDF